MILVITQSHYANAGVLLRHWREMGHDGFIFNLDRFDAYRFEWRGEHFHIADPLDREIDSTQVEAVAIYKGLLQIDQECPWQKEYEGPKMIRSMLNAVSHTFAAWAIKRGLLRLWTPYEMLYPKFRQMAAAQKYFAVPEAALSWNVPFPQHQMIVKPLVARSPDEKSCFYARKIAGSQLAPEYPWFTQEIAEGDRDATVLYINGHIHSYQFATVRGELTDWRVTQGTERNRWERWEPGPNFERKVADYMREMGLKYGRLDFIIGGETPQFLEVNPCGQFGFLDDLEGKDFPLHREAAEAILDPSSTVCR